MRWEGEREREEGGARGVLNEEKGRDRRRRGEEEKRRVTSFSYFLLSSFFSGVCGFAVVSRMVVLV